MRVVEIETQNAQRRYVVIDNNGELVEPIVCYLKYLDRIGSARLTLRSYATALRLYWEFLLVFLSQAAAHTSRPRGGTGARQTRCRRE